MMQADYKRIIDYYLSREASVDEFIAAFMEQWRFDRDNPREQAEGLEQISAQRFGRLMNRLFTSCDCYDEAPEGTFEISEEQLRQEVGLLAHIWWG